MNFHSNNQRKIYKFFNKYLCLNPYKYNKYFCKIIQNIPLFQYFYQNYYYSDNYVILCLLLTYHYYSSPHIALFCYQNNSDLHKMLLFNRLFLKDCKRIYCQNLLLFYSNLLNLNLHNNFK
jgi:hypothetical protein